MKVTRFSQSCLIIEDENIKILIDPGIFSSKEVQIIKSREPYAAIMITHEHPDHCSWEIMKQLINDQTVIYCNDSTAKLLPEAKCTIIADKDEFMVGNLPIKAIELPHCLLPNGQAGPKNTGYVVNNCLFHPGDGIEVEELQVQAVALPITGPDISMLDAFLFADKLGCRTVIPIHYDFLGANPEVYSNFAKNNGYKFELRVLGHGQSTDI